MHFTKGTTLVEILLACAVAAVGIVFALGITGDLIAMSAKVKQRETTLAEVRVALKRLKNEIAVANTFAQREGYFVTTFAARSYRWRTATLEGHQVLARCVGAETATVKKAVAADVLEMKVKKGTKAITIAITTRAHPGAKKQMLEELLVKIGETL